MYSNPFSSKSSHKKPVYRSDGRVIGNLVGDTLIKSVFGSRHMLRTPKSWAVDTVSVMQAKEAGAKNIEIRDRETGSIYRSSFENFLRYGIHLDRGFGKQIALPLEKWSVIHPGESSPTQPGLFMDAK